MKNTPVLSAKRFGIYSCHAGDTLKVEARVMNARNISALVVVNHAGLLDGITARTDIVSDSYGRDETTYALGSEYMNHDAVTVELDAPLSAVMELLINKHIHRVVAVAPEAGGLRPVAVLSAADIVYHMAQD